jgi:hypothetical protein
LLLNIDNNAKRYFYDLIAAEETFKKRLAELNNVIEDKENVIGVKEVFIKELENRNLNLLQQLQDGQIELAKVQSENLKKEKILEKEITQVNGR